MIPWTAAVDTWRATSFWGPLATASAGLQLRLSPFSLLGRLTKGRAGQKQFSFEQKKKKKKNWKIKIGRQKWRQSTLITQILHLKLVTQRHYRGKSRSAWPVIPPHRHRCLRLFCLCWVWSEELLKESREISLQSPFAGCPGQALLAARLVTSWALSQWWISYCTKE